MGALPPAVSQEGFPFPVSLEAASPASELGTGVSRGGDAGEHPEAR